MRVLDPGHTYQLAVLDSDFGSVVLTFVKREGDGYPGNVGHHPGTNLQEVLRACIDRVIYLDRQVPDARNSAIVEHLRSSLYLLEKRAADRHQRTLWGNRAGGQPIERAPTCGKCGHIGCDGQCHA